MKFFSDPNNLYYAGVVLTMVGLLFTGVATVRSSNLQAKAAKEIADSQKQLTIKSDQLTKKSEEISKLNREIADNQSLLREDTEKQLEMQKKLAEKSEENALLNSQLANINKDLRLKSEAQIESQSMLKDKIENSLALNKEIVELEYGQNQIIGDIKATILDLENSLVAKGIIQTPEKHNAIVQVHGASSTSSISTVKLSLASTSVTVANGGTQHLFDNNLSISADITTAKKNHHLLHAILVSLGKKPFRVNTDKVGYKFDYEEYSVRVDNISHDSVVFFISINVPHNK
ncbi:hypothetical protein F6V30_05215 [Oryzomonas sagensis]|uniref:Uncharacterized protein n=1 Tax=Oryzomonas sagensis TaxID=2603857 RepID=A0ABQ6TSM3_9BACT|nr:hypothetical protein [Oryzomonas sagensis]KAB0671977.1 hypothetical protein F6V30_05215 [Oryzomonas sagensis]